jgi:hypothetical protein
MTKIVISGPAGGGGGSGTVTSVAATVGNSGTDVNITGSPITISGTLVVNIPIASSGATGKLSSTDWSNFNNKQAALVSGSNIKTINGSSILGSGDLVVTGLPSGTDGQVQYNNGGAFGGASALFYDDVQNFVGIGTPTPGTKLDVDGAAAVYGASVRGNDVFSGMNIRNTGAQAANRGTQLTFSSGPTLIGAFDSAYNTGLLCESSLAASYFIEYWNGSSYAVRLIVLSSGNVGIGTLTPAKKLEVEDSNQCVATFTSTTTGAGITFSDSTTSDNEQVGVGAFGDLLCLRGGGNAGGTMQISGTQIDCRNNILKNFKANILQISTNLTIDSTNEQTYGSAVIQATGALTITFDSTLANGFNVSIIQMDANQTTIATTGATNVRNRQGHTKTAGQYATITLLKNSTNLFLGGDTGA